MNRKVILYLGISLDGYIADRDGGVAWMEQQGNGEQGDYGFSKFLDGVDTVLIGMKAYLQIVHELFPSGWPYRGKKSYVFTHQKMRNTEFVEFVQGDAGAFVSSLRAQAGRDIWVCGGADLANQLIQAGEVDEYQITTLPVILGGGIPLFGQENPETRLRLKHLSGRGGAVCTVYTRR